MGIAQEVELLQQAGSQVLVIAPDAASAAAIGANLSDLTTRQPAALAGRAQGRELADAVAVFLAF